MNVQVLLRLTRIRTYIPTLLSIIGVIFLISPKNLISFATINVFFTNLLLTAFVYTFNDVEDAIEDYGDLEKRKRNPISTGELTKGRGYLISLLLVLSGLVLSHLISLLTFFFAIILVVVGFLYSWKQVRLKSIPYVDITSHILCLGVLQFFITYLAFKSFELLMIPFLMIIIPLSLTVEIVYEIKDFNIDKKTKMRNTVQKIGKKRAKKFLIPSSVIATIGFIWILFTIPIEYLPIILFIAIISSLILVFKTKKFLALNG